MPCPPDPLLELSRETLEARGQVAVGHVELLDEATGSGQSLCIGHLQEEGGR